MTHALEVTDLTVTASSTVLVDAVSFTVEDGERVALLGRSGSGKSLTALAVCGSLSPALTRSGTVEVATRRGRADVALVAQDSLFALNPLVPVGRQLERPLRARGATRAEARVQARDLLASTGIEDPDRVLAGCTAELSGGQRQRVCVALALACESRLLVADEPTTALDVVTQDQVLTALEAVPAAQLFITHDVTVAARLCTRALVMDAGRLVEDVPMRRLLAAPSHPAARSLVAGARARTAVAS